MKIPKLIPSRIKRCLKQLLGTTLYYGKGRYCPVCDKSFKSFRQAGIVPREDAECLWCGSLERDRLVWMYFTKMSNLFDGQTKKMLHIAPEPCFESRLKSRIGVGYLTADLFDPRAMITMDITNIQYPDESFDVIYCSHVLEHVPDDKKAMREIYRVLKGYGWVILLVPITAENTIEDPNITDPAERLHRFGREDHVRRYGIDFLDRLTEAEFKVEVISPSDFLKNDEILLMGITDASGEIYHCTK